MTAKAEKDLPYQSRANDSLIITDRKGLTFVSFLLA